MRWTRWTPVVSLAGVIALALPLVAAAPHRAEKARRIERGEYLATVMGCNDCHTPGMLYGQPDFARRMGGSDLGWRGPHGVSYASNLTPDTETGIGRWTEQQIVNAIRAGMRPDGRQLLPPMPWPNFARLTDEDAFAIAAYLKSLPPVKHASLGPVPPDRAAAVTGSILDMPPPPAWDVAAKAGGAGAAAGASGHGHKH
jgi:mono/diheme cytochrome c family protein